MSDDLIKRSDAIAEIYKVRTPDVASHQYAEVFVNAVRRAPSADRPQGEWKFVGSSIEMMWACPFCGERTFGFEEHLPNYCSNCGADLRGTDIDDKENDESH